MLENGSLDYYLIKLKKTLINIDKNKGVHNTCIKKKQIFAAFEIFVQHYMYNMFKLDI